MKTLDASQISKLSMSELEVRLPRSLERMQAIQADLETQEDRQRKMSPAAFERWRSSAVAAHRHQMTEYRRLRDARRRLTDASAGPVVLLEAALAILRDVEDLSPEELVTCEEIEAWLSTRRLRVRPTATDKRPADAAGGEPAIRIAGG